MAEIQTQAQADQDEGNLGETFQQVLRVARKRRWWILLSGLGTLLAAIAGLNFIPNVYLSEATILIVEQQIPQNLVAPLSTVTGTQRLQAMTQEVLSRSSLLKIIDETHLYADKALHPDLAVELMRKSIRITPEAPARDGSFGAFEISFSASTPGLAQEVTRRLASLFIERHSETRANRANSTIGFVKERLTEKKKRAGELEQQIRSFKALHAGQLPQSRMMNEARMTELRVQLQSTLSNLSRVKQQSVVWELTLTGNLNSQLGRMKTERSAMLSRLTPKHPLVTAKDEEIALMEQVIATLQSGTPLSGEPLRRLGAGDMSIAQLHAQIEGNRVEAENLAKDQKRLEGTIAELQRHLNLTPALEEQLSGMTHEAEVLKQEIAKLEGIDQQSAMSADMERRQQGEQFRQLEPPALPLKPQSPARFKISAGALMAGLVLGFVAAFLTDMRAACFQTEAQILRRFSPPWVLSVPDLPTPRELRARKSRAGLEWVAGCIVVMTIMAVEYYVYRHS